ncbi:anti-sigma factor [Sphingomonas sp. BGYR3]|uniref:anti-sigma factor n=1 Tax=Sphingomonas sp. BGYR3 TaxID=2975483 RepID=UPI0021A6B3CE|nr:anti-sigma factor [Sphingomonas sp. BGYR3]MDG5487210.1 anti-sigma factor [Sphingomonas sp. BGYR3]
MTEELDLLAGELALGVLDGAERAEALRLRLSDPEFAAAVERWESVLAPLSEAASAADPADLWQRVEPRLTDRGASATVSDLSLRRSVARWRAGTVAAASVAAALALVMVTRPAPAPVGPPQVATQTARAIAVAQLSGEEEGPVLTVRYEPGDGALAIRAENVQAGAALAPELWVIPDGAAPQSLGQIAADGTSRIVVPIDLRRLMQDGAVLAITIEKQSATPHPAPSSSPVAVGRMATI